jgi:hypothetical protein
VLGARHRDLSAAGALSEVGVRGSERFGGCYGHVEYEQDEEKDEGSQGIIAAEGFMGYRSHSLTANAMLNADHAAAIPKRATYDASSSLGCEVRRCEV